MIVSKTVLVSIVADLFGSVAVIIPILLKSHNIEQLLYQQMLLNEKAEQRIQNKRNFLRKVCHVH
jgi:hypothetical protein